MSYCGVCNYYLLECRCNKPKIYDKFLDAIELSHSGEPTFTLRAQDTFAADLVERWANLAEAARCPASKVLAARAVARAMFEWRTKKLPD